MISVSANHFPDVPDRPVIKGLAVRKILPSRLAFHHQQANLVTGF